MKFQKFEISFLIFGSILVVLFNVILVALKVLVVFEIFKETSNKFAVKFLSSRTVLSELFKNHHSHSISNTSSDALYSLTPGVAGVKNFILFLFLTLLMPLYSPAR